MLKKINHIMNIIIGVTIGVFIGSSLYDWWHFNTYPEMYAFYSAPWYTGVLVHGFLALIVLLVTFTIKLLISKQLKKQNKNQ